MALPLQSPFPLCPPLPHPPQVQWQAQIQVKGRGVLWQLMPLCRRRVKTAFGFHTNKVETYIQKQKNKKQRQKNNIHLGYNTLVCVCASSVASGGVFHSRSQCDSGSRLCFQDNHRHNTALLQMWATHNCLLLVHSEVHLLEEEKELEFLHVWLSLKWWNNDKIPTF